MDRHPVRLRKRLDPTSLVAAERHPVTGRLAPHGRRDKARSGVAASMARTGFSGLAGVLAAGAVLTLVAGAAAAAVKSGPSGTRPHPHVAPLAGQSPAPSPTSAAKPASLPAPCALVSQAAAQHAVGAPVDTSENKPASCLYAGTAPAPFRTLEIRYERHFDAAHVRQTLAAAHVAPRPLTGLATGAFAHPAFLQTANGTTQFLPAEAVVPVGDVTVIISTITLDESAGHLVDPAADEVAAVAVVTAALAPYLGH
ncbi:MAG: hypothetical protein QOD07_1578 [Frankiaceae bacterium]|jgi:hypothetical protein|nr:hypothetical protein [Frankiaceae bacterium]